MEHDYTRRDGVVSTELIVPDGGPVDRGQLWNAAEAAENRKDARTAREWVVALPAELDAGERADLARSFSVALVERYGVAVDLAIHSPDREGDNRNHHAHVLTTTRRCGRDEYGRVVLHEKATIEQSDSKRREAGLGSGADEVTACRELWATMTNAALARARRIERVSHLTLKKQGINRAPTTHLGPVASEMERRGVASDQGDANRQIETDNAERARMTTAVVIEFDQVRLERLPESELRKEIKRREPESFEMIAEGHPLIAPTVQLLKRAAKGAEWCKERLHRIAGRIAKYLAKHDQGRVWDSVQRLAHRAVGSLSAGEQWLAKQQRQMARTERVRDLRQIQIKALASDVRELAEQLRPEIEHALGKQVLAQRRVYGELARREIEDQKRTLASEAQREREALEARRKYDEDRELAKKEAGIDRPRDQSRGR